MCSYLEQILCGSVEFQNDDEDLSRHVNVGERSMKTFRPEVRQHYVAVV